MRLPRETPVFILTGAGISAESGLATFRDADGLWQRHRVEDLATPAAFARDPKLVHAFYNARRAQLKEVRPNAAHLALARLEKEWAGPFLLVTQNVDDLHERAGSRNVLHMHGELAKVRCERCRVIHAWTEDCLPGTACAGCGRKALRPHIVWFGEVPLGLERIEPALTACGLFAAIGTSGQVHPASDFVSMANPFAYTLEINADQTRVGSAFFEVRTGLASGLVPALVEELLGRSQTADIA